MPKTFARHSRVPRPAARRSRIWQSQGQFVGWFAALDRREIALALLLCLAFLAGGSVRADVASLLVLRPVAVLLCVFALLTVRMAHVRAHQFLVGCSAAVVLLVCLHLVPLPPVLWQQLPGRDLIVDIDRFAGMKGLWRPLTLAPGLTRNALWSLAVPLAVLLLGMQLASHQLRRMLLIVGALGLASALVAVLQLAGDPRGVLYLYDVTNNGSAVGLFANRNHQALLLACLFPILGYVVALRRDMTVADATVRILSWSAALLLLPLVLVTGSRSGMLLCAVAAVLTLASLLRERAGGEAPHASSGAKQLRQGRGNGRRWLAAGAGTALVAIVVMTILLGRGLSFDRLLASDPTLDLRARILPTVFAMITLYAPWGSGLGSFQPVFQIHEPDALLSPTYVNHVHNDWLEVVLTGGIPAAVLMLSALFWVVLKTWQGWRSQGDAGPGQRLESGQRLGGGQRLAGTIVLLCAAASLTDYPLRVPSLGALAMLCLLVLSAGNGQTKIAKHNGRLDER